MRPRSKGPEAEARGYEAKAEAKIWPRGQFGPEALTYLPEDRNHTIYFRLV